MELITAANFSYAWNFEDVLVGGDLNDSAGLFVVVLGTRTGQVK